MEDLTAFGSGSTERQDTGRVGGGDREQMGQCRAARRVLERDSSWKSLLLFDCDELHTS